jgi:peptidoglycan/xylan/chitin deacetylase (PgdA/CDA1 family)
MIPKIPSVPQRMMITLYGAMLLVVLLGTTAVSLRGREPHPAALAQGPTVTRSPSASATVDASATVSATPSRTLTASATATEGPSATPSRTPSRTPTATYTASPTPTNTPSPTPTYTPTLTPTSTNTPTPYPTPGPGAANREVCVPILTYHHIGYAPSDADELRLGLTTSPELFEQHLKLFQDNGIVAISLKDLQYALALGWPLPERRVIITMDDGYDDIYQYAFPLLQKYGVHATLFIPTQFIDDGQPGYMTWPQIEEMSRAGNDIEPHTKDHVDLRHRSRDYLIYEILGSKQTIEAHTGQVARFFAYPAGAYDDNAIAMLKEMNFWSAVSTDSGVKQSLDNIYTLKRLRVSNSIDVESMKVYLRFCGFDVP